MTRQLSAIVAASVAWAYVIQFCETAILKSFQRNILEIAGEIFAGGIVIYFHFFMLLLFVAVLQVLFLNLLRCWSARSSLLGGAFFGVILGVGLVLTDAGHGWNFIQLGALCGAIGGWVYWAIAIGGRPRQPML
jgi:hypothetical protein